VYANQAYAGGGLNVDSGGLAKLDGCNIHENTAHSGGGLNVEGGEVAWMGSFNLRYVVRPGGVAELEGCNIYENAANFNFHWGAKGEGGGGLTIKGLATLTNTNVYANRLAPSGEGCEIYQHEVPEREVYQRDGYDIYRSEVSLTLRNVSFSSSESSCSSVNNMLKLGPDTTIHCPLGWWVPPPPLILPPMCIRTFVWRRWPLLARSGL